MKGGIYCIRNAANGKVYVGSAVNLQGRWRQHWSDLRRGRHHSAPLQRAFAKYGEAAFSMELLEVVTDPQALVPNEQRWIDHLKCVAPMGYNVCPTAGSILGLKRPEVGAKLAIIMKGRKRRPLTDAEKAQRSLAGKERGFPRWIIEKSAAARRGRKMAPETIAKMVASRTGKKMPPRSDEWRAKQSIAQKGKPWSPARRAASRIKNDD